MVSQKNSEYATEQLNHMILTVELHTRYKASLHLGHKTEDNKYRCGDRNLGNTETYEASLLIHLYRYFNHSPFPYNHHLEK